MSEPWRRRCPEGHCSWTRYGERYYCEVCERHYDALVDAKTGKRARLVTDGGTVEQAESEMLDDRDPVGVAQALELQLGSDEPDWDAIEDAGQFLTALARRRKQQRSGGADDD